MQTILACIDYSDTATPVLDRTAELAKAIDARVVLLHVDQPEAEYMGLDVGYIEPPATDTPIEQRPGYQQLQQWTERLQNDRVEVEPVYEEGLVVECILDHAGQHEVDLIVLGSHGHGSLYHLMMGSITEGVLRHAKHPVLVVPAPKKKK